MQFGDVWQDVVAKTAHLSPVVVHEGLTIWKHCHRDAISDNEFWIMGEGVMLPLITSLIWDFCQTISFN